MPNKFSHWAIMTSIIFLWNPLQFYTQIMTQLTNRLIFPNLISRDKSIMTLIVLFHKARKADTGIRMKWTEWEKCGKIVYLLDKDTWHRHSPHNISVPANQCLVPVVNVTMLFYKLARSRAFSNSNTRKYQ